MFDPFKFVKEKFGTSAHQLVRRDDPVTSFEAANRVDTTKLEQIVLKVIKGFPEGCIADQVLSALPEYSYASVTPRFSALLRKKHIEIVGVRPGRSGRNQRVMRAA